jgi:iron(III) transport system substrate-binding protein
MNFLKNLIAHLFIQPLPRRVDRIHDRSRFIAIGAAILMSFTLGCTKEKTKKEFWVYTSLYKDTIADIEPLLKKQFPDLDIKFFQAGSEDVAAKINTEELAGGTKADVVIFSDRFWFEEMAGKGKLQSYKPKGSEKVPDTLKHAEGFYTAVSLPVMVMVYNNEVVKEADAPKTFKEMMDPKWKNKFSTGSPLSSGTNFTTMAFLQEKYGWDYFKALKKNGTISEGSNSAVIRRVQSKERPVGWVLLENALRLTDQDKRIKVIYPEDGVVLQNNVMALIKKPAANEKAQQFADWMFSNEGQAAMTRSFMYSPISDVAAPVGAPPLAEIFAKAKPWSAEFLTKTMTSRESLKEEFTKIMFQ